MSQEVDSGRCSDSHSRLTRPYPFSVASLMCDRGLQKSRASPPPVTKYEHKFSVENLLQNNSRREEQGSVTVQEPVKCGLNLEERVIKDGFTSWLSSQRYDPASKYVSFEIVIELEWYLCLRFVTEYVSAIQRVNIIFKPIYTIWQTLHENHLVLVIVLKSFGKTSMYWVTFFYYDQAWISVLQTYTKG